MGGEFRPLKLTAGRDGAQGHDATVTHARAVFSTRQNNARAHTFPSPGPCPVQAAAGSGGPVEVGPPRVAFGTTRVTEGHAIFSDLKRPSREG